MSNTDQHIVFLVRFKSRLSYDELFERGRERMPKYRAIPGLIQKYYVHDPATNEYGGFYVWDSQKSLDEFLKSDLRKTIASTYEIIGEPRIETYNVAEILRTESPVA